jgi:hypothetical protein
LGDKDGVSSLLHNLGQAGYLRQEYASARTYSKQSLELYEQLNSKQGIVVCLILLGQVATWCGEGERAARLFGAASVMAEDVGFKLFAADREEYDRSLREAMSQLSEADWARLWDQGRAMKQDDAVAYALGRTTRSE